MNNLLDPTKSNELIYKGLSQHNGNLNQISSSSSIIIEDPSYQTIDSTVTSQNETESLIHCNSGNKSLTSLQISLNNSLTDCLPEMYQPIKNDGRKYKYIKNTSRLNSFKSGLHSLDDKGHNSSQLPESTIGSPDNTLFDSFKHLSILDPVNLKAVYQRHDPEFTNSSMIYQNQPNKSDSLDNLIQNLMPTQNNPSSSGVRRFIHTFLSSAMDLKVFGEPVPTYEHPQLTVCNESCVKILKRFHTSQSKLSELTSNFNDFTRPPGSICQLLLANPDIYVNDREFTSIIAFALTTPEYERKLVDLHSTLQGPIQLSSDVQLGQSALANFRDDEPLIANINVTDTGSVGKNEKSTVILNNEVSVAIPTDYDSPTKSDIHQGVNSRISSSSNLNTSRDQKQPGLVSASPSLPTGNHLPPVGSDKSNVSRSRHIKIQFSDSSTNFFCCIYYAAEFFRLRQLVMPNGDMSFIQSLSRCYHWDARGGKSGSLFMKTRDERFVIKELSSIEMKTFHEISHEYFDYLITSALDQRLCVLSRILGIFHVGFKNSASGEAHRFDVLVMENLFHGRTQLAYIYDLKGSLRKRLADESSKSIKISTNGITPNVDTAHEIDENMSYTDSSPSGCITSIGDNELSSEIFNQRIPVLLDQNLLNASIDNPLYLRVHSKNALSHCLNMDTTFLANLFIMDYSLLVGVDTSTNQLVVGLIDYLRKFTLDKRLEMIIKQTITSAQGPMPTILTPDLYRERFLYQLHSYFPWYLINGMIV
ncbi:unnamed protein product [Heterobilharzia americana]|nr:unnamed protein product [Heterobilharzia americana]